MGVACRVSGVTDTDRFGCCAAGANTVTMSINGVYLDADASAP